MRSVHVCILRTKFAFFASFAVWSLNSVHETPNYGIKRSCSLCILAFRFLSIQNLNDRHKLPSAQWKGSKTFPHLMMRRRHRVRMRWRGSMTITTTNLIDDPFGKGRNQRPQASSAVITMSMRRWWPWWCKQGPIIVEPWRSMATSETFPAVVHLRHKLVAEKADVAVAQMTIPRTLLMEIVNNEAVMWIVLLCERASVVVMVTSTALPPAWTWSMLDIVHDIAVIIMRTAVGMVTHSTLPPTQSWLGSINNVAVRLIFMFRKRPLKITVDPRLHTAFTWASWPIKYTGGWAVITRRWFTVVVALLVGKPVSVTRRKRGRRQREVLINTIPLLETCPAWVLIGIPSSVRYMLMKRNARNLRRSFFKALIVFIVVPLPGEKIRIKKKKKKERKEY